MSNNISSKIMRYKDEILEDIIRLVQIQSIRGKALDGMPFGEGPAKALNFSLQLGKSLGFETKNVDNYAGHIEYGEGDDLLGILAHVDVVPPGEGWTMQPFSGEIKDGRIYGRGTMDDKGAIIAAIYCLKVLRDLDIKPKMKIRVIIGAAEETGMEDMEYYFSKEQLPDYGFTPDSEYPICNREKGILRMNINKNTNDNSAIDKNANRILSFKSGTASNIVPDTARACIYCTVNELLKIKQLFEEYNNISFDIKQSNNDTACINCFGKAAHASEPEKGQNSAAYLIEILAKAFGSEALGSFFEFLHSAVGLELDGKSMGIAYEDEQSGKLTLNLGIVNADINSSNAVIDIRYPVSANSIELIKKTTSKVQASQLDTSLFDDVPPLFVSPDSPLIKKLTHAFETVTGQKADLFSTGGGTYARALKNRGVAFGAGFKSLSYYNIHAADEFLDINEFLKHCEICLQAIYEIGCN
jgi:succinyl-diaminopimelate desuccinylase